MAEAAAEGPKTPALPHPLRRLLAYMIDKVFAWLLLGLIVAVTGLDTQDELMASPHKEFEINFSFSIQTSQFRPMLSLGTKTCGAPVPETRALLGQALDGTVTKANICISRIFGVPIGGFADLSLTKADGSSESGTVSLGTVEGPLVYADHLALVVMLAASWIGLVAKRRTPGKWLTGLKVTGRPLALVAREMIRMSPVLGLLLLSILPFGGGLPSLLIYGVALGIPAGLAIWLWLMPILRDEPYVPWDRWTGCRLTEADQEPVLEHPF
ncbi:hypothetical protein [Stagnihabitans tardus]|uniref:RDD domain-containing protein n=1 Tax=Stagnihabitans tardus TaxID=2699202 RepID=A0AAE4Y9B0_9RHOB|nr:hypothetical protein [Stagnihabitans tardus]NBZ88437.1 hypothetical protein [Stagnihabitans tardus]